MEVKKEYLVDFLGKNRNLIIPVYQRNYAWKERECKRLFEDIVNIYTDIEMPLLPVLSNIERNGVLIDPNQLYKLSKDLEKSLQEIQKKCFKIM